MRRSENFHPESGSLAPATMVEALVSEELRRASPPAREKSPGIRGGHLSLREGAGLSPLMGHSDCQLSVHGRILRGPAKAIPGILAGGSLF
jgi:hypothetical protein